MGPKYELHNRRSDTKRETNPDAFVLQRNYLACQKPFQISDIKDSYHQVSISISISTKC